MRGKRTAFLFSLAVHMVFFLALAVSGLFAYLGHHEEQPIDVTVYDESAPRNGRAGGGGSSGPAEEILAIPSTPLPAIDETYTESVVKEREIKKLAAQTGVDVKQAAQILAERTGQSQGTGASNGGNSTGPGTGTGAGPGNGSGEGPGTGSGTGGNGTGAGVRPAQKAVLIYQPDARAFYPPELLKKGIEGIVYVGITISADGAVVSAAVAGSSGYASMDSAALQIAYLCQYRPAENGDGQPVSANRTLRVPFTIQ